ncbi:uncharacterized protein TNIN_5821 [Trichonephila inaurata madagascariensis]|uniref:Uncharacterized protein n=1 Tax=Trichonephila inaurata madagascariensis TaxID=2747483 RepID=A0A8X7BWG7_9ARAC|nr:uncharacterized protein TNIN_5821 [Trichonephila inaurata madagascariensis]
MDWLKVFVVLSALVALSIADCSVDDFRCCLSEFLPLVSPAGIQLTEKRLAAACTIGSSTLECIEDYTDNCVGRENEKLEQSINKTKNFIGIVCPTTSEFMKSVKEYENCFQNASLSFQTCYNKTLLPDSPADDDKSKWKAECCEYKNLRNCAVQSVEDTCGATASQVLQDEITNLNGAGLELACQEVFGECSNSAVTLASPFLFIILAFLYMFL